MKSIISHIHCGHKGRGLLASTALACSLPCMAFAQAESAGADESVSQNQTVVQEIVVTGSRLRRNDLESPSPVAVLSEAALERKGTITVQEAINELPQLGITNNGKTQNFDALNSGFSTGGDFINLRNLGAQRTLVLVNNRRFIGGDPGTSSVDMNSIPAIMVSRVDVVTGAASAVYGADAVSGVVNVMLKDKFEGALLSGRTGISSRGDAQEYGLSGIIGGSFADDRGGALVAAEWTRSDGYLGKDRKFGQFDANNFTVDPINGSGAVPGELILVNGGAYTFDLNDNLVSNASLPIEQRRYQRQPVRSLSLPIERINVAANAHYDLIEDDGDFSMTLFTEASYAHSKSKVFYEDRVQLFTGSPLLFTSLDSSLNQPLVPANNPYVQALIVPVTGPVPAEGVTVFSRLSELGSLTTTIDRETFRIATGIRGNLPGDFNYEAYYQHGRLTTSQKDFGAFSRTKFAETLNVSDNGTPLDFSDDFCANPTALAQGCVPFNFFGQPKPVSQALLDYIGINSGVETEAKQTVVSGYISGSLFSLPAGDVGVVLGAEYRKEEATIVPASSYADFTNSIRFLAGLPTSSYDVKEFFAETNIPILSDMPFIRRLEVGGAIRFSDYSTVGSKTSWSIRGEWEVSPDIRFRGVYSTAVRAPNLKELYSPATAQVFQINDPCDTLTESGDDIDISGNRATACAADLGAAAATFDQTQLDSQIVTQTLRGNANLKEEKAKTYTIGTVITPQALRGFSATIDYYHIEIDNVISTLPLQDAVNQCYDQATRPTQFCSLITRSPVTLQILNVQNGAFNAATETLAGLDTRINYTMPLDIVGLDNGRLDINVGWSRLFKHDFKSTIQTSVDKRRGQVGDFKNRYDFSLYYSGGPISLGWQTRIYGKALGDSSIPETSALAPLNHIPSVAYHDVQVGAALMDDRLNITFGVKNLFDKQPPIITSPARTAVGLPTAAGIYDTRGRFFYTSASIKF